MATSPTPSTTSSVATLSEVSGSRDLQTRVDEFAEQVDVLGRLSETSADIEISQLLASMCEVSLKFGRLISESQADEVNREVRTYQRDKSTCLYNKFQLKAIVASYKKALAQLQALHKRIQDHPMDHKATALADRVEREEVHESEEDRNPKKSRGWSTTAYTVVTSVAVAIGAFGWWLVTNGIPKPSNS